MPASARRLVILLASGVLEKPSACAICETRLLLPGAL
jgi:hypothetical protein